MLRVSAEAADDAGHVRHVVCGRAVGVAVLLGRQRRLHGRALLPQLHIGNQCHLKKGENPENEMCSSFYVSSTHYPRAKTSSYACFVHTISGILSATFTSLRRPRYLQVRLRSSRARLRRVAAASAAAGAMTVSIKSSRPSWYAVYDACQTHNLRRCANLT